jgi:hypothetical protein
MANKDKNSHQLFSFFLYLKVFKTKQKNKVFSAHLVQLRSAYLDWKYAACQETTGRKTLQGIMG